MTVFKEKLLPILMCLIGGGLVSIMVQINASLGKYIGLIPSSMIAHLVGAVFLFVILYKKWSERWWIQFSDVPWYMYLGGVLGFFIVIISNFAIPIIGVTLYTAIFVSGVLILSMFLDQRGLFGFPLIKINFFRILGAVCTIVAVYLLV